MGWFSEQSVDVEKQRVRDPLPHAWGLNARVPLRVLKTVGGEETPLTVTQGGVHRGAPTLRAAPPPRIALSGALVLNTRLADPTAYSAAHRLEPRDRSPGTTDP